MKVLLTGAMGFLGSRTLEKLVDEPGISKIRAAARTNRDWRRIDHNKVDYIFGDLTDKEYIRSIVDGMDVIIHVAALSSMWGKEEEFYRSNVLVQQMLIEQALEQGIQRFIYISSPSIYREFKDKVNVKETDPPAPNFINAYAKTKWAAEKLLTHSKLRYIIIRPRAIFGKGDTVVIPRLIRAYKEGKLRIMGNGQNLVDLTPACNVADAIILALFAKEEAWNEIYHISNGEPVKLWEKLSEIMVSMGMEPPRKKIPEWQALLLARILQWKARFFSSNEPVLTVYGVNALSRTFTVDISKAKRLLGYEPKVSVDEAAGMFVDWYHDFYE